MHTCLIQVHTISRILYLSKVYRVVTGSKCNQLIPRVCQYKDYKVEIMAQKLDFNLDSTTESYAPKIGAFSDYK